MTKNTTIQHIQKKRKKREKRKRDLVPRECFYLAVIEGMKEKRKEKSGYSYIPPTLRNTNPPPRN